MFRSGGNKSLERERGSMKKWGSEYGLEKRGIGEALPGHMKFSPVFVSKHATWYVPSVDEG